MRRRGWLVALGAAVLSGVLLPWAVAADPAPVAIRLTTAPDPSEVGESVTLTAAVRPASPGTAPTGTVEFRDGPAPLGSAPLDGDGVARLDVMFASPGNHPITAEYSGDDAYRAASTTSTHTVDAAVSRKRWVPGASGVWSNPANWEPPGPPVDGDTVELTGSPSGVGMSTLDIAGLELAHLSFTGGGHMVQGSPTLGLAGSIHDDSERGGTLYVPIALSDGDHIVDRTVTMARRVSGAGGITKTGGGSLMLNADNTYGGATTVDRGLLLAMTPTALGDSAAGTTVHAGASLVLTGGADPLTLNGDGGQGFGALHISFDSEHTGPVSLQGDRVTVSSTSSGRLAGEVSGPAALRKTGPGTLILTEENSYEGGTDVAAGTLRPDGFIDSLGDGPVDVRTGAVLDVTQSMPLTNDVRMAANSVVTSSTDGGVVRGSVTLAGPVVFRVPSWQGLLIYGAIGGTGPIRKEGSGPLWFTLNTTNTMSGTITVAEGTLLGNKWSGAVAFPDGVSVAKDAQLTLFSDDQIGDAAPLLVHGDAAFVGTGDRLGALQVTGLLSMGIYFEHAKKDFGVLRADSVHFQPQSARVVMGVDPQAAPSPGESHDQLRVSGDVSLGGRLFLRGNVPWGTTITLIDNVGTAPVSGTFDGAPEGAHVPGVLRPTYISYRGGDGNDVTLTTPPARSGYWMLGGDGAVYPFGQASHLGDAVGRLGGATAVDLEPTTTHNGYWILLSDGTVLPFGDAAALGSAGPRLQAGERATSISNTSWNDYWVFTDRGRALPFGQAQFHGDMSGTPLNGPVLGSVGIPFGWGYYMVGSDGGIFAFGEADFHGSMGGKALNGPVVGLSPDPDQAGYWLVATDGGIFAFEAPFRGSMGGRALNRPVVGMVPYGNGYLMVAADGGIFNFSDKPFHGSLGSRPPAVPVVSVAPLNEG